MKMWIICINTFVLLLFIQYVLCVTRIEVEMVRYNNPSGVLATGVACDLFVLESYMKPCDTQFTFCLDKPNGGNAISTSRSNCKYLYLDSKEYEDQNSITFDSGTAEVIDITDWLGGFKLKTRIRDIDLVFYDPPYETIGYLYHRFTITPDISFSSAIKTRKIIRGQHGSSLVVDVSAYCTSNWYGHTCSVYCADHQLDAGFICDPSGNPVCNNEKLCGTRGPTQYTTDNHQTTTTTYHILETVSTNTNLSIPLTNENQPTTTSKSLDWTTDPISETVLTSTNPTISLTNGNLPATTTYLDQIYDSTDPILETVVTNFSPTITDKPLTTDQHYSGLAQKIGGQRLSNGVITSLVMCVSTSVLVVIVLLIWYKVSEKERKIEDIGNPNCMPGEGLVVVLDTTLGRMKQIP